MQGPYPRYLNMDCLLLINGILSGHEIPKQNPPADVVKKKSFSKPTEHSQVEQWVA